MNYQPFDSSLINNQSKVFIRVDSVEVSGCGVKPKSIIECYLGPRKLYKNYVKEFTLKDQKPNDCWSFTYTNPSRSSFVLELARYNLFKPNDFLGRAELLLKDFHPNHVTKKEIILRGKSSNTNDFTKVTLLVHPCEDGSSPFRGYAEM